MSKRLEDFINENREAFDTRMPDPAVLQRIQQQVAGAGEKKQKGILVPMRMVRLAAACCILLAGIALYQVAQKTATKEITATVNKTAPQNIPPTAPAETQPAATASIENEKITSIHAVTHNETVARDIAARKQVLFASLNNMESPSQRLQAAMRAAETSHAGKDIVDALVHTMNNDPSSNVRLAALEGLGKFYREPYVRKQLIASLKKQKDPLVQIGLIDLLAKMKEASILNELDRIVKDGNTMEAVKDHAYSGIFTLRS